MIETRNALITGASRGLGLALTGALIADGWRVIADARDGATLHAALDGLPGARLIVGDVTDGKHRKALASLAGEMGGLDAVINNASTLGATPLPHLLQYPQDALEDLFRTNVVAPLMLLQSVQSVLRPGARIINVSSDAAVEAYEGWGGYGAGKAALEQISAVLAVENEHLRIYWVDPGDMRTRMQQDAFPDEDISDRPLPEESVPGFLALLNGEHPSGRYAVRDLAPAGV
ncbi:MAG: SDR family NAD(P)-dependent oxidoreductase [Chloroflexota bacterium]